MAVAAVVGGQGRKDAETHDKHVGDVCGGAVGLDGVAGLCGKRGNLRVRADVSERVCALQDAAVVENGHDVAVVRVHVGAPHMALVDVVVVVELVARDAHVDGAVEVVADEIGQQRQGDGDRGEVWCRCRCRG